MHQLQYPVSCTRILPAKPAMMRYPIPSPKIMPRQRTLPTPETQESCHFILPPDPAKLPPHAPIKKRPPPLPVTHAIQTMNIDPVPLIRRQTIRIVKSQDNDTQRGIRMLQSPYKQLLRRNPTGLRLLRRPGRTQHYQSLRPTSHPAKLFYDKKINVVYDA